MSTSDPALTPPPLTDGTISLRAWTMSDVVMMLGSFDDPWFRRFNDWAPTTAHEARAYLAAAERCRLDGNRIELAIVGPAAGDVVLGGVSLHDVDRGHRRGAVGYWLAPDARGRGVASRAVRMIGGWAFGQLGLARLELTCGPDNSASQRVAERCGFTREGVLRSHSAFRGGRRDTVVFSVLAGELI